MPVKYHRVFIPKAIAILSRYPFYDYFSEILEDIYNASKHHVFNIIEAYINKLVLEVSHLVTKVYNYFIIVSCSTKRSGYG